MSQQDTQPTSDVKTLADAVAAARTQTRRVVDEENIYRTEQYEDEDGYDR